MHMHIGMRSQMHIHMRMHMRIRMHIRMHVHMSMHMQGRDECEHCLLRPVYVARCSGISHVHVHATSAAHTKMTIPVTTSGWNVSEPQLLHWATRPSSGLARL